jgi:MarR family transcriptional regulator, organic hydroperoxide resistance regulator
MAKQPAKKLQRQPRAPSTERSPASARDKTQERAIRSIRALVGVLQTSARAIEVRTGLTNAQLLLLRQIAGSSGLTINDLVERTSAGQSSVSVVVARLVRSGHVRRGVIAADGRRVTLTATARGRTALRRAPRPATERFLDALRTLAPADTRSIVRGLGALLAEMGEVPERAQLLFEGKG